MNVRISVIVPVYNVKKYLHRCMDALLTQTFAEKEIILVDDGSTDGSDVLCNNYAAPGVTVIHQKNAGLGMARNSGLKVAKGEYVFFMDSDDYIGPDLLENLYLAAQKWDADICIGGFTRVFPGGERVPRPRAKKELFFSKEEIRNLMLNTVGSLPKEKRDTKYGMSVWSRLYRRSILEDRQILFVSERELISEDLIFNLDFLKYAQRAVMTEDIDYFYCLNPISLSKKYRPDRFQMDCRLYETVQRRLEESFKEDEYRLYLHRMLIARARADIVQNVSCIVQKNKEPLLKQSVAEIINSELLQSALKHYPWWRLPIAQGIFAAAMKRKRTEALIWLTRMRQRRLE